MAQHEDCPLDPNHQNVIDISSDDGCDNEGFDGLEDTGSQEEQSSYFQAQPDVEAFNARCRQSGFSSIFPFCLCVCVCATDS